MMAILFRPQYVKVQLGLQQSSYNYLLCHVESIVIKSAVVASFLNEYSYLKITKYTGFIIEDWTKWLTFC